MENIHVIFQDNGYPEYFIKRTIEQRVKSLKSQPMSDPSVSETVVIGDGQPDAG